METERQKFFRKKTILKESSKHEDGRQLRPKKVKHDKHSSAIISKTEVTVLGSTSYINQKKDISIVFPPSEEEINPNKENNTQRLNFQEDTEDICSHESIASKNCFTEEQNNNITVDSAVSKNLNLVQPVEDLQFKDAVNETEIETQEVSNKTVEGSIEHTDSFEYTHENIIIEIEVEKVTFNQSNENSINENNSATDDILLTNTRFENAQATTCNLMTIKERCTEEGNESGILQEINSTQVEETSDQRQREVDDSFTNLLSPTIKDIIPEKEMDLLRKSIENENAEVDIDDNILILPEKEPEIDRNQTKKRQKTNLNKAYVDFLSDDEDFVWDSTSWKETGDSSSESDKEPAKKKKKKLRKRIDIEKVGDDGLRKRKQNKRKKQKEARASGKEYIKKDGSISTARNLHSNPCVGKSCGLKCGEINEDKRKSLFDHYWSLTAERRKDWIVAMSARKEIKRKRSKDSSYRTNTFEYFINDGEGRRQVCLQFLLKTLDVTQRFIYYTVSNASSGSAKADARGKIVPKNKTPDEVRTSAVNFIKSLPALPSHYCRKESTRLYLPTEFKNIKNLYRIYKEDRVSKGVDVISEKIFRDIFNKDFNLGFHVPKKDKCTKCLKYEGIDKTSPEIKTHLEEKEASKNRLECHRELHKKNPSILCTSFDLQKVLNTPHGNSMLLFYSRKYTVYNLCFYESLTRNGFCYVWGETEGKRGGNEVASILQKYIHDVDARETIKTVILYSDSCPGQNKNKIVLAALHNALLTSKHLETLQMNYLLPGHTEMTVDSIHSTIESSIRNTIVWAPSQWITICQLARKEPRPYQVESLAHDEFKNFDDLSDKYFKGNLAGKISKIRIATFKKSTPNIMSVKYSMKDDAQEEAIPIISKPKALNVKYKASLPITKAKYNDLKKLCDTEVIPKVFHNEYLKLTTYNGKDFLVDTDIEDEVENAE